MMESQESRGSQESQDHLDTHHILGVSWSLRCQEALMRSPEQQVKLLWSLEQGGRLELEDLQDLLANLGLRGFRALLVRLAIQDTWVLLVLEALKVLRAKWVKMESRGNQETLEKGDFLVLRGREVFQGHPAPQA